ncbi:MAG: P1 family peptidase [Treponema sp.]|nr:P1 family peptidase [Candidatus Treponema equifaecale]
MQEIDFSEIEGVFVGNSQNNEAKTGVTVFYFPHTAMGGVHISGGGPASRETPVLDPERADTPVNALVLGGGSAYGLAASDGVMRFLEQNKIGFNTRVALVPIVVQSDIYDLGYGRSDIRPDSNMGMEACWAALSASGKISSEKPASSNEITVGAKNGNYGGGTGATVGKICGPERMQKSGIGFAAFQVGELKIGAAVVLNAFGDIYFEGKKIAGLLSEDKKSFTDSVQELYKIRSPQNQFNSRENTTIGAIFTNGNFTKAQLKKIANMATAAYDRGIRPVGTMGDGDTIYAFSCAAKENQIQADLNVAGTLAAQTMELAIKNAIQGVGSAC